MLKNVYKTNSLLFDTKSYMTFKHYITNEISDNNMYSKKI